MRQKNHMSTLWLFTEHRNATFIINFELPKKAASKQVNAHLESWSSAEVTDIGLDAVLTSLRIKSSANPPTAAIFSRYVAPHGKSLIEFCKSLGILTLFHLDDLLQELPADLGLKYTKTYSDRYKSELNECIGSCDGILASTDFLSQEIAKLYPYHNIQTVLGVCYFPVPGWSSLGIRSRLARLKRRVSTTGVQTLGYMGSSSHVRDLATITPHIGELLRLRPNLRFETLGLPMPDSLKAEFSNRVWQYGFTSTYQTFLETLYELRWDLGLAPLVRDSFNQSKTPTKFIEYTACEIPTLAEDIAPYSHLGRKHSAVGLATGNSWVQVADHLLSNSSIRDGQLGRAKTLCRTNFTGSSALAHLHAAIENLTSIRKNQGEI